MGRAFWLVPLSMVGCGLSVTGALDSSGSLSDGDGGLNAQDAADGGAPVLDGNTTDVVALDPEDGASLDAAVSSDADADFLDATPDVNVVIDAAPDVAPPAPIFGEQCPPGTVYDDDFSTDPATNWIPVAGNWTWNKTNRTYSVSGQNPHGVAWIGPRPLWRNYDVTVVESATPANEETGNIGPIFRVDSIGTGNPPPNDSGRMYFTGVDFNSSIDLIFGVMNDGWTQREIANGSWNKDAPMTVRVQVTGNDIRISVNGTERIDTNESDYGSGSVGIRTHRLNATFHRVTVTCR